MKYVYMFLFGIVWVLNMFLVNLAKVAAWGGARAIDVENWLREKINVQIKVNTLKQNS